MRKVDNLSAVLLLLSICTPQVLAFGSDSTGNLHEQIVSDALSGTICDANLKLIQKGVVAADKQGAESANDPRIHFKTGDVTKSLGYVDREKRKILNYAMNADTDEKTRARALFHFGQILHTLQDFYSRSNYIELKEDQYKDRPYEMDLPDWTDLLNQETNSGTRLRFEGFDKSTPESDEGKKAVAGTTYFKIARALAERETQRQWNLMEALIRNKAGGRANDVITALSQKPCDPKTTDDITGDTKPALVPDI
jgi:hypothetical protein